MFDEKVNKLYVKKKYIAAGQIWWVDMEDKESTYKYEETTKIRLWLVLSSNAEAAFCVPLTHRIGRNAEEVVITTGSNDDEPAAIKSGYIRRLAIERFINPSSSLVCTLSRKSLKKAWSVVMYAIMADEFDEHEANDIIKDSFVYATNAHKSSICDNWSQLVHCNKGDIYSSMFNMNEEAIARLKYINGYGYEIDYNVQPHMYNEEESEYGTEDGQGDHGACQMCNNAC